MRIVFALVLSVLVHIAIVAVGFLYFPRTMENLGAGNIVPIDIVTLSDETNVQARDEEVTEIEEDDPVDEVEAEIEAPNPTPPPAEEAPPEPEPVEAVPADDEVETVQEEEEESPPPPDPEPEPERPAQSQTEDSLDSFLNDLAGSIEESDDRVDVTGSRVSRVGAGTANTATLVDLFRTQANPCWRNSRDAPNPERLTVEVVVQLNRDGSLSSPPRAQNSTQIRSSGDRYWRVAEDRALAAVVDCAPYNLPVSDYSSWRRMIVTFRNDN